MRVISLWQPWASLIVHGKKRIETRSWEVPPSIRLPCVFAVHAAKKWNAELEALCYTDPFEDALFDLGLFEQKDIVSDWNRLPFGAVVGLVRVARVVPTDRFFAGAPKESDTANGIVRIGPEEFSFGDFRRGRFGWVCDRFHALAEPIPLLGHQSIWDWDAPAELQAVADGWMRTAG